MSLVERFFRQLANDVVFGGSLASVGGLYAFTDLDTGRKSPATGRESMAQGLQLQAKAPRTALIFTFMEIP